MINSTKFRLTVTMLLLFVVSWGCDSEDEKPINGPNAGDSWVLTKASGDNQTLTLHDTLTELLTIQLKKLNGTAIENESVLFKLIEGNGNVYKSTVNNDYFDLQTITDFEGKASAQFLNFISGSGFSKVSAEVVSDSTLIVIFTINSI